MVWPGIFSIAGPARLTESDHRRNPQARESQRARTAVSVSDEVIQEGTGDCNDREDRKHGRGAEALRLRRVHAFRRLNHGCKRVGYTEQWEGLGALADKRYATCPLRSEWPSCAR